jgi:enterochelin esterase family protein
LFAFYDVIPSSPQESGPFFVGAQWTGWEPEALRMAQVPGTRLHYVVTDAPTNATRGMYKLVYGPTTSWFQDPNALGAWWDGFDVGGVGSFNSAVQLGADPQQGRLVHLRGVDSPQLDNARDVFLYLPPGYDGHARRLPSLYFHDGNESLTRADFAGELDRWTQANPSRAFVAAFVHLPSQDVRLSEYTFGGQSQGDDYVAFLAETLVPQVDANARTLTAREQRGVFGMSLGGLISYYAGLEQTDTFGRIGGMSSSFFWDEDQILRWYEERPRLPLVCYLDSGSPADNFDVTSEMAQILDEKGYDLTWIVEEGARHEWSAWKRRLPGALDALMP